MIMSERLASLNERGFLVNVVAMFLALAITAGTFGVFLINTLT
jgi:hypothetical protein